MSCSRLLWLGTCMSFVYMRRCTLYVRRCTLCVWYIYHHVSVTCAIFLRISCDITCELGLIDYHVTARVAQARAHLCMCTVLIMVVICMCMEQLVDSYSCLHLPSCGHVCMTRHALYPYLSFPRRACGGNIMCSSTNNTSVT